MKFYSNRQEVKKTSRQRKREKVKRKVETDKNHKQQPTVVEIINAKEKFYKMLP